MQDISRMLGIRGTDVTRDDRYSYRRVAISIVGESGEQTIYGIADEKAGGYVAFVTDEKTAATICGRTANSAAMTKLKVIGSRSRYTRPLLVLLVPLIAVATAAARLLSGCCVRQGRLPVPRRELTQLGPSG